MNGIGKKINKKWIGEMKRGISALMIFVLVFTMCQIPPLEAYASATSLDTLSDDSLQQPNGNAYEAAIIETEVDEEVLEAQQEEAPATGETDISYDDGSLVTCKMETAENGDITVYINGTGNMKSMADTANRPWDKDKNKVKTIVIRGSVSSIGSDAFNGCSNLESVVLETDATDFKIHTGAFAACEKLAAIDFSNVKLTYIGQAAFSSCSLLKDVVLPQNQTIDIDDNAFIACSSMESFLVPKTCVVHIGEKVFCDCDKLKKLTILSKDSTLGGKVIFLDGSIPGNTTVNRDITIACTVDSNAYTFCQKNDYATALIVDENGFIDISADEDSNIEYHYQPVGDNYVLEISGEGAMRDMKNTSLCPWYDIRDKIIRVNVTGSIRYIGAHAFIMLENATQINIASNAGTVTIGEAAFAGCHSLQSIDLSNINLITLSKQAFVACDSLEQITLPALGAEKTLSIGEGCFDGCSKLEELIIPLETQAIIGTEAFRLCNGLKKVHALNKRTAFEGSNIFWNGESSEKKVNNHVIIRCQKNSTADGYCALNSYAEAEYVDEEGNILPPDKYTVRFIDYNQEIVKSSEYVEGYELTEADVPTTEREGYVFMGWTPEAIGKIITADTEFFAVYDRADKTKYDISASGEGNSVEYELTEDGVLNIRGSGAIRDFAADGSDCPWKEDREFISKVVFSGPITFIGANVCKGLSNCESISFSGITKRFSIGNGAFEGIGITSLVLPALVNEVAESAFWNMANIKKIDIYSGILFGNPFSQNITTGDVPVISFFKMDNITLEAGTRGQIFAACTSMVGDSDTMVNIVFDKSDAIAKYKNTIDWSHINDVYVPNDENAYGQLSSFKEFGCNVTYEIVQDKVRIKSIVKTDLARQLNLPQYILNYEVAGVDCEIPSDLAVLHENTPHQSVNGVCSICKRRQYRYHKNEEKKKYQIDQFDEDTDYYILVIEEAGDDISIYELAEDLTVGKVEKQGASIRITPKTLYIPSGCTLIVPDGKTLKIERGSQLIIDGTLIVEKGGTLVNYGTLLGKGSIEGEGKFITSPNEDTIRFGNEDDFYDGNPNLRIIILYIIDYWDVSFDVDYGETEEYYEKYQSVKPLAGGEKNDANWTRVQKESELAHHGIYRYVYVDAVTGKKTYKRFEVRKPYGTASVAMTDWIYGDAPNSPSSLSSTNYDAPHVFYYKKVEQEESEYQRAIPTEPGKYNVRVKYLANADYQEAVSTAEFEIKKRPITVTIDSVTREYGENNPPSYSYKITDGMGLITGDTIASLNVKPLCMATPTSDVGDYDISATAVNDYYDVTVIKGKMTITPITATLTLDENYKSYTKTFGDESFVLQGLSKTGDGTLTYEITGATDVVSVDEHGEVSIENAGQTSITVSLPDTINAKGAGKVTVTIQVEKAAAPVIPDNELFYLKTKINILEVPLTSYLPADYGTASFAGFHPETDVSYEGAWNATLFATPLAIDAQGILRGSNNYSESDGAAVLDIPVSMRNYQDTRMKCKLSFMTKQAVKVADGQAVELAKNELVYGNALGTLSFKEVLFVGETTNKAVNGILKFNTPNFKPEYGAGTYDADWIFTPDASYGGLYEPLTGTISVIMRQADPVISAIPETDVYVYDTKLTLKDVSFIGGNTSISGSWKWMDDAIVPECDNTGYDAIFIPDSPNYRATTRTVVVKMEKAQPYRTNYPSVGAINYKDQLGNSTITGGTVEYKSLRDENELAITLPGEFKWKDETIKPYVKDSDVTEYDMVFIPTDSVNYKEVTFKMTITVNKAGSAPGYQSGEQRLNLTNDIKDMQHASGLPADWVWTQEDGEKTISANTTISANAVYNGVDKGCYVFETMTYWVTRAACEMGDDYFYTEEGDIEPTCITDGIAHKECTICHDILERDIVVDKLGHSYKQPEYTWTISENSADTKASVSFVCERSCCKETDENHEVVLPCDVIYETTAPLCEVDGKIEYHAKVVFEGTLYDQETYIQKVDKLGHDMHRVNKDNEEKEFGFVWTALKPTGYSCAVRYLCSRCQHSEVLSETATSICTATCTEDGETIYTVSINSIYEDTVLSATRSETTLALGHNYFNTEYTKIETCTEDGYWTKYCNFPGCDAYLTEPRKALGHVGGRATCSKQAVCERCHKGYGKLDPNNHEASMIITDNILPQLCTMDGYSGDVKCLACGNLVKTGTVLPMFGRHNWDDGVVLKAPTALEKGETKYTCRDCGTSRVQVVYFDPKKDKPQRLEDDEKKDIYHITVDKKDPEIPIVIYVKPVKPIPKIGIPEVVVIAGKELPVTRIEEGAFKKDKDITSVVIGKNIEVIPKNCFNGAEKLKSCVIGDGVTKIEANACKDCKKLSKVKIGKNVEVIGDNAFANCSKLKKITIPAKVTTLGNKVFSGNKALKVIVIKSKKLKANKIKKNAFKGIDAKTVIKVPKTKVKAYKKLFLKKGLAKNVKVAAI